MPDIAAISPAEGPRNAHYNRAMADGMHSFPIVRLALEDGTVLRGRGFGSRTGSAGGEVVFNTAMTGYQEALTDPSYAGQILVMTATQIGNYGVCEEDVESARPHVRGFVVRELSRVCSNHRASTDLSSWLAKHDVIAMEGLDTRALVRRLRTAGVMRGVISADESKTDAQLVEQARHISSMSGANLAAGVSPCGPGVWTETLGEWSPGGEAQSARPLKVVALDCGAKRNIYRNLADLGCEVTYLPHSATADEIRSHHPDGLFISNGPGDPAAVQTTIDTLREIAGEVPTFGICLGHQLLALALGAKTYKLKFGHRGANQPVRNLMTGRVEITSQNHGFCVEEESLRAAGGEPTHAHLNDGTLAGFRHREKPIFSVQYHPEASPGPHDSAYLFDAFVDMMQTRKPITSEQMRLAQSKRAAGSTTVAAAATD